MTSDRDLRALFEAWLRDRGAVHRLANLSGAVLRAYTEAVTAAAVRTPSRLLDAILAADERGQGLPFAEAMDEASRYLRRQSPAEAPAAAEAGPAGSDIPDHLARALYEAARGLCGGTDWNNGTQAKYHGYRAKLIAAVEAIKSRSNPPAITYTDGSPLRALGGSMHERTEARLAKDGRVSRAEVEKLERTLADAGVAIDPSAVRSARRDIEHTSPTGRLEHAQADFARPMVPR